MKKLCMIALVTIASTAAMAQSTAQSTAMAPANGEKSSAAWAAMDTNHDGMISQDEYMAYHTGRWSKYKQTNGKVALNDMEENGSKSGGGTSGSATTTMGAGKTSRFDAMDTNHDGMISQEEYMAYHTTMWGKMKRNDKGMVPMTDMQSMMEDASRTK